MHYYWGLGSVAVVIFVLSIIAWLLFRQKNWFLIWLRGSVGVTFLGIALALAFLLYPMMEFKTLDGEVTFADVRVEKIAAQNFNLHLSLPPYGSARTFNFNGDQWVMTAKTIDWMKPLQVLGIQQGYLVSGVESHFISVEQAEKLKSSKHMLDEKNPAHRMWSYLDQYRRLLPFLVIQLVSTKPVTFIDGAEYKVTYTKLGAKVRLIQKPPVGDVQELTANTKRQL